MELFNCFVLFLDCHSWASSVVFIGLLYDGYFSPLGNGISLKRINTDNAQLDNLDQ